MADDVAEIPSRDLALGATGVLAEFNRAGIITAPDIQVAQRLARLAGCDDRQVLLASALAVRAVRHGSVCLDLERVAELDPARSWPAATDWRKALLASPLVRESGSDAITPMVLDAGLLYLDRYWSEEGQVCTDLLLRENQARPHLADVAPTLDRYFPDPAYADQRRAAESACRRWTSVITGGPGTGKTTTIARLLGVLLDSDPQLRIALAAPTGRAAARLAQAVRQAAGHPTFPAEQAATLAGLPATTLHRLLGWMPSRRSRFRHDRGNRLPFDVIVIDETSMVSLTMMARLVEAVRPQTRLVLVGDADQLASVDAGAVLGDLVAGLGGADAEQVSELGPSRRFGPEINALAAAVRDGDAEAALGVLTSGTESVQLIDPDQVEPLVIEHAVQLRQLAATGDREQVLAALDQHRLLCAHREGPYGAGYWNRRIERNLAERDHRAAGLGTWYIGRPIIVTDNDYGLNLFNGDTGVVMGDPERAGALTAVIADGERPSGRGIAVARLAGVRSAHAMTVHRSQGSQVDQVTVLLPEADSRLLTRQLLYTAVTRATTTVRIAATTDAVRSAVQANVQRASGLARRLSNRSARSVSGGVELIDDVPG
ncbi:MAG: exodeoxyribonuclease V subunit alpha [Beutenbergiaceae bacterium]